MMQQTKKILTKLRLINWHYFADETITLKNTNLFSGENGAGKSTILDAIQLVLTTNSRKFNQAANAESRRTLKSYVRGKTGEEGSEYLRTGAVISYIALEVYEESRQRYFVLGVKMDSPDPESDIRKKWFCEEGTLNRLTFTVNNKPATDEQFRNGSKKVQTITQATEAKDRFLKRLGGLQYTSFGELLAKSIAFKPMNNVKSFVSHYILPERTINTDDLRENIRQLQEMRGIVDAVRKQVQDLEQIRKTYQTIQETDNRILVIDLLLKIAEYEDAKATAAKKERQHNTEQQNLNVYEQTSSRLDAEIESQNKLYLEVCTALNSGETARMIQQIQNDLESKAKDRSHCDGEIKILKEQLLRLRAALQLISNPGSVLADGFIALGRAEMSAERRNAVVTELEQICRNADDETQSSLIDLKGNYKELTERLTKLSEEIKKLEQNQITFDPNVTALKAAIEQEFTARGIRSDVHILADLLEVIDSRWQNAVEGYLNTQRFHIIVEPKYYDIAAMVYDKHKSRIHTAAIVNTAKLDLDAQTESPSLASVVSSENRYALAYVRYLLGRVTMCENVSELKAHSIAITPDCMLYQGHALRKINPAIYKLPYIGKYALQEQLRIKREEYQAKSEQKTELDAQISECKTCLTAIRSCNFEMLKSVLAAPLTMQAITNEIGRLKQQLTEAQHDSTYIELQIKAETMEKELKNKREDLDDIKSRITLTKNEIQRFADEIQGLNTRITEMQAKLRDSSYGNDSALADAQQKYAEHQKTKSAGTILSNYQPRRQTLINQRSEAINKLIIEQMQYKDNELGTGTEMMPAYEEAYTELTKHDLIRYEEQLRTISENCETEFRESFLARMRENLENAKKLFSELNRTLKPIPYGNDYYSFSAQPEPQKQRLYDMITSNVNLGGGGLFATQFEEDYHDEMDELFAKLTSSDANGEDVIREYSDYRSYLDYDILIHSADGKTQKFSKICREKSGGETQTPYYVAIAASFQQIYSTGETIRVIMLDEAFDKMDEARIESMLSFFKKLDFQIILAAPTSRLELIGEQADQIIMIHTDSSHCSFSEEFSYDEL